MRFALLAGLALAAAACGPPGEPDEGPRPAAGPALFREASSAAGLSFRHIADASDDYRLPEIMGAGVALLDYDLDGDLDVYLLQGGRLGPGGSDPSPAGGSRLFRNRFVPHGVLAFEDVTEAAGLAFSGYAMGVAVGDYDGDGAPDVYVTAMGPNALFRNLGDGSFARVEGPQDARWSGSASFVDYDLDGDLDLFVTNYVDFAVTNNKQCFSPAGARDYCNPTVYNAVPDRLFQNRGGSFWDVSAEVGLGGAFGNGLGVTTADLNHDGWPDLYVANDGTENQLWINHGGERFENSALLAGAAVNADGRAEAGMGVLAADFDADGDDDLLLTHNSLETNTLYLNNGDGLFLDMTNRHGLGIASMPFTGFGLAWSDFDHDGLLDAFIANGAVVVIESQRGEPYPFRQQNQYFRGVAGGFEVADGAAVWGALPPLVSRGLATGDLDLDGDLDLVVSNNNGPARMYVNQTGGRSWLRVRLRSSTSNTRGLGARVVLRFEGGGSAARRLHRDGSYLSSSEPVAHFGLAGAAALQAVEVRWPGGEVETYPPPPAGTEVTLRQGSGG